MTDSVVVQRRLLPSAIHLSAGARLYHAANSLSADHPSKLTWDQLNDLSELAGWLSLALQLCEPGTIFSNDVEASHEVGLFRLIWEYFKFKFPDFPDRQLRSVIDDLRLFQAELGSTDRTRLELAALFRDMDGWVNRFVDEHEIRPA